MTRISSCVICLTNQPNSRKHRPNSMNERLISSVISHAHHIWNPFEWMSQPSRLLCSAKIRYRCLLNDVSSNNADSFIACERMKYCRLAVRLPLPHTIQNSKKNEDKIIPMNVWMQWGVNDNVEAFYTTTNTAHMCKMCRTKCAEPNAPWDIAKHQDVRRHVVRSGIRCTHTCNFVRYCRFHILSHTYTHTHLSCIVHQTCMHAKNINNKRHEHAWTWGTCQSIPSYFAILFSLTLPTILSLALRSNNSRVRLSAGRRYT